MAIRSHLDSYLWPLALICTLGIVLPILGHHSVLEARGGFVHRGEAQAWIDAEYRNQRCISFWRETKINDASVTGLDLTNGHPFSATLKCHRPSIYWKLAAALFGPWLLMAACIRLAGPPRQQQH